MNVMQLAAQSAVAELAAWSEDPLRYLPDLRSFVQEHDLLPVIALAQELSEPPAPGTTWGRGPGYGWQHGLRVAHHALELCDTAELREQALDRLSLFVAALTHDLVHTDLADDHQRRGGELVAARFGGLLPAETVARAAAWVTASDRPGPDLSLAQQVLWDANALDLHGGIFLVRGFMHAAANELPVEVMLNVFAAVRETHQAWLQHAHFEATRRRLVGRARGELEFCLGLAREMGHPVEKELAEVLANLVAWS